MPGTVTRYGDPNEGSAVPTFTTRDRTQIRPSQPSKGEGRYRGLTVGKLVAVKYHDPRAGNRGGEVTRFGFIFNEEIGDPQILFLPGNMELEKVRPELAAIIAAKVAKFPEFLAQKKAELAAQAVSVTEAGPPAEQVTVQEL